jgi:hypothetical protein
MKRRVLLILVAAVIVTAGAAASAVERAIVPDMNFVGERISLTLDEAIDIMQTAGSMAEAAKLNKAADEALAKGYSESAQSMSDMLKASGLMDLSILYESEQGGLTEVNEKIMKMRRDFAKDQLEANYKAELNSIEATTVQIYYGVILAEENLKIAKDGLSNQKTIYENTMKKYKQGTVAKIDTITAETQVLTAEDRVAKAETAVKNAKMSFNLLLGYDVMQDVKLTEGLKAVEGPKGNLTGFIESAIEKRNEIKGVKLMGEIQEMLMTSLKYRYPSNSSTYLKQEAATLQAQKTVNDIIPQIEMDIRSKYMNISDMKGSLEVAEANLKNAKEGFRLATISYNAGVNTLADLNQAQIASYQAALGVAAAITDYDLAVYNFHHAIDVGTTRLPL